MRGASADAVRGRTGLVIAPGSRKPWSALDTTNKTNTTPASIRSASKVSEPAGRTLDEEAFPPRLTDAPHRRVPHVEPQAVGEPVAIVAEDVAAGFGIVAQAAETEADEDEARLTTVRGTRTHGDTLVVGRFTGGQNPNLLLPGVERPGCAIVRHPGHACGSRRNQRAGPRARPRSRRVPRKTC